jgi:hypothetical protein
MAKKKVRSAKRTSVRGAGKKRVSKKTTKKKTRRAPALRVSSSTRSKSRPVRKSRPRQRPVAMRPARKIGVAFKNLVLFLFLFIVSILLKNVSNSQLLINFFWLLSLITGFVALAFLIVWLVFVILRGLGR